MLKKYEVIIVEHAEVDIKLVFDFINESDESMADQFVNKIYEAIFSLEIFPERNPIVPENSHLEKEYRHLIFHDYRIIYRIILNKVIVIRFLNQRQLLAL